MNKFNKLLKTELSYVTFTVLVAIYFALVINLPIYKELASITQHLDNVKLGFLISVPLFFAAALNFLFNLFSWPWITKPFFVALLVFSSAVSYAGYNYGTMFDYGMVQNIFETDSGEAQAYISQYSIIWVAVMGIIPAILVAKSKLVWRSDFTKLVVTKVLSMAASLAVIAFIAAFYYQDYASIGRNNSYLKKMIIPTQFVYSTTGYIKDTYLSSPMEFKTLGAKAQQSDRAVAQANSKPNLVVFVMGETARAQNYQVNGYPRPTNQYTQPLNMITFHDVRSCGTATAVSVPCLFTNLTHDSFDSEQATHQDNWLDILQHAGVDVLWKENDGGDKSMAARIKKIEVDRSESNEFCDGSRCYDMALLEDFERNVDSMDGNRFVVMHLNGSHGPTYYKRYPESMAQFQPACDRADIENCTQQEIINSYDNTILYTDYVVSQTIKRLQALQDKYNAALVYVSDHGESLGEHGVYLHGLPYSFAPDYQNHVPLMMWFSDGFQQAKQINLSCLESHTTKRDTYSHDNLFHSMLGLMDVETDEYDANYDLFKTCRD
ncbi:phosphoethanolamine--lipid A transferase [Vibrio sp. SCSIO 43135]|uniref:phosphoethanolamine transferase n=1 Tax=Vibrio sp. SCSIO 43135 TaxID=2819096 RepID=UPI002075CC61|nr:phosphoethanolamine--lipid A transferase [Vibrio sp. SCSIO 43135]USD43166.1 phosphoethanolamine--lipid A transferase [Vibrio sp. SCSIO 43135]